MRSFSLTQTALASCWVLLLHVCLELRAPVGGSVHELLVVRAELWLPFFSAWLHISPVSDPNRLLSHFNASPCACGRPSACCAVAPVFVHLNATLLCLIASFCYLTSRVSGSRLVQTCRREELQQRLVSRHGRPLDADGKASWLSVHSRLFFSTFPEAGARGLLDDRALVWRLTLVFAKRRHAGTPFQFVTLGTDRYCVVSNGNTPICNVRKPSQPKIPQSQQRALWRR